MSSPPPVPTSRRLLPLAALLLLGACGGPPRPNVLLVVVDTLRADRLGCHGADRDTSPALDALAADGVRFDRAYAPAPWTRPSVATILTGLYPSGHGVVGTANVVGPDTPTLATLLAGEGFATAAVNSNKIVTRAAYGRGFDLWDQEEARGPAFVTTPGVTLRAERLLEKLAREDEPFFLYVHYMDPHVNYVPHEDARFAEGPVGRLKGGEAWTVLHAMRGDMTPEEQAFLHDLYDGEVLLTDRGIGRLVDKLRALGEYDDTLVVVTADHGEELLDHGNIGHTRTLYEELLHVPFVVKPPAVEAGRPSHPAGHVVEEPVSLVSLAPTVLDLLGVAGPAAGFQAPSLVDRLHGLPARETAPIFAEVDFVPPAKANVPVPEVRKRALLHDGLKVIVDGKTKEVELYDLALDPGETRNLADERRDRLAALLRELEEAHRHSRDTSYRAGERRLSAEDVEDLKDLGYAE